MECKKVNELIPFLHDGSIDADTQDTVRKHIEHCHACKKEYQKTMNILSMVRETILENQPAPGLEYLETVKNKISRKKKVHTFYYRAVSAAAVVLLTVSFGLYSFVWRDSTKPIDEQYTNGETLDTFIATHSLTGYELNELAEAIDIDGTKSVMSELLVYNNAEIDPEDIIELLDDDELVMLFAELER